MNTQSLRPAVSRAFTYLWASAAFCAALASPVFGQGPAFSVNPMRLDVEAAPGTERTVSFEIRGGGGAVGEHGRLEIVATDWAIQEDGALTFPKAASEQNSAMPWITFSPSAMTILPGRSQLVRITVAVPEKTAPGVYRAGFFIQERASAAPPDAEARAIFVRFRYAFILFVVVGPATAEPELVNVEMDTSTKPPQLICEMTNTGTRHIRPVIYWTLRNSSASLTQGKRASTVLLPGAKLREPHQMDELKPGSYEVTVNVDFQDGKPQQSMSRAFEVKEPEPKVSVTVEFPEKASETPEPSGSAPPVSPRPVSPPPEDIGNPHIPTPLPNPDLH